MKQTIQHQYMAALQFFSLMLKDAPRDPVAEARLRGLVNGGFFSDWQDWCCFAPLDGTGQGGFPGTVTDGPGDTPSQTPDNAVNTPAQSLSALARSLPPNMPDAQWREGLRAMRDDHLRLFSGPSPLAPPWESVWRERDKLLFGECTRQVAELYEQYGLTIDKVGREPEDHLALELAFAFYLLRRMPTDDDDDGQGAASPDDQSQGDPASGALAEFLDSHLLPWAGLCLQKASAEAESVIYREITRLCWVMLRNLRRGLFL
jgi:TorA maturation chaperone TorD